MIQEREVLPRDLNQWRMNNSSMTTQLPPNTIDLTFMSRIAGDETPQIERDKPRKRTRKFTIASMN
jgi:hypothetical protein